MSDNFKLEKRTGRHAWAVIRQCCVSGYCTDCHKFGRRGKPVVCVVQMDGLAKASAEFVARNWSQYNARAIEQHRIIVEAGTSTLLRIDGERVPDRETFVSGSVR